MATPVLTANEQRMLDEDKAYGYTASQSQQLYDRYAQDYEREGSIHENEIQTFLEAAQLQQGESILDLGCGNGVLTLAAKKLVGHGNVIGVDISQQMLGYARQRIIEGMHFLWGDIEQLGAIPELQTAHPEELFDVIFARKVLHNCHQPTQISLLQHWASFLAPGGRLIVDQAHEYRHLAQFQAVKTPGFEPFVQLIGSAKSWVQCRVYFHRQILDAGLKLDKMVELGRDGDDLGPAILQRAKADWDKTGRAGDVPPDAYIEGQRRQAYADLEEAMSRRNGGWSGLSVKLVSVLAVIKRA